MKRPFIILYILGFYVLFQFCWWAYLLIELNDEVHKHKIENVIIRSLPPTIQTQRLEELDFKAKQRQWMVVGEGVVFLSLLIWGIRITGGAFKKEMFLARQQKNFLLSITHEFKSPLASIKLYLQTLLKHDLEKEKTDRFINNALRDTERLNTLVENTLMANLIDHEGYTFSKEDLNVSALVRLLVQKIQQLPDQRKIETTIEEGIHINADKNAIGIMITNLIENALKYSPADKTVKVNLFRKGKGIFFSVTDEGVGIPEKEKQNIFRKFYRIGNEETRNSKGTGLGLFIVKYIVDEHNGNISIENNEPNGTQFSVVLPS